MKYRELSILLPCHSLEDFPLYHVGQDADSLLACWTALWHPALLAAADSPPKWHRIDLPPDDLQEKLILVPTVSVAQLPTGFGQRAKEAGAVLLRGEHNRQAIIDKALEHLDGGGGKIDSELVADFFAVSYAYLQVQILTRQMRYASNLDEVHFFNQLLAGAAAAAAGKSEDARGKLVACFDKLAEERDHYYSVDAYLLDVTLVAEQTLGQDLRSEIESPNPINLMISGRLAELLKDREPDAFAALRRHVEEGHIGLIGGEYDERRLPLLPSEELLAAFRDGERAYKAVFGRSVEVFGRRQFGLSPFLPAVFEKLRFRGAIHATMDDGHFPSASQIKTRWQGVDASVIDAIAKPPLDASKPETFLSFAQKLGESMDNDHVATLCLAHWPGRSCPWYEDLKRCSRFTAALGKFITAERYFADTYLPGHLDRFEADRYKSPYLRQDVIRKQPNPISSVVNEWRRRLAADAIEAIKVLQVAVSGRIESPPTDANINEDGTELVQRQESLARVLPKQSSAPQPGYLVVNPCSFARRVGIDVSQLASLPAQESPVLIADEASGRKLAVVEVPPMGFAWVTGGKANDARKKPEPCLVEDLREKHGIIRLRNEFMEAMINPITGAMQSLSDYKARGNRLSQQLALRTPGPRGQAGETWRDPDANATYSVMVADEVRVLTASSALGEVETRGRLLNQEGQPLAAFRQIWRLWRGSRVLQLEVEIEPRVENSSDPWNSYYACRFAWSDEAAELFHAVNESRQPVSKKRIESPLYVEVESGEKRTTILTGGLPYHRLVESRILDSLLIVRGETARNFHLGIGVDLNHSLPEARGLLTPATLRFASAEPPNPTNCWLFHIDGRSIVATHWSPLIDDGRVVGVRARLLEGGGRAGRARLTAFRAFQSARQVNFLGETISELSINDGKVALDFTANEWIEVEARWS